MKIFLILTLLLIIVGVFFYLNLNSKKTESNIPNQKMAYEDFINEKLMQLINMDYPNLEVKINEGQIISKNGLTIQTKIINHRKFKGSESFQIHFYTSFPPLFERDIEERLAGVGDDDTTALINGVKSFLAGQFPVIMEGIRLAHSPEIDFDVISETESSHWHPIAGDIQLQGEIANHYDSSIYDQTFNLIKPLMVEKLKKSNQSAHWFRYYVSISANGEFIGDCYYDNEPCEEGLELLKKYCLTWTSSETFSAQKQFLMFRKCGR